MSEILESSMRELYYAGDKKNQADNHDVLMLQNITSSTEENAKMIRQEHFLHPINTNNLEDITLELSYLTVLSGTDENKTAVKVNANDLLKTYSQNVFVNDLASIQYPMTADSLIDDFNHNDVNSGINMYLAGSNYFTRITTGSTVDNDFVSDPNNLLNNYRYITPKNKLNVSDFYAHFATNRRNNTTAEVNFAIFFRWNNFSQTGYVALINRLGYLSVFKYINGTATLIYSSGTTSIPLYSRFSNRQHEFHFKAIGGSFSINIGTSDAFTWSDPNPIPDGNIYFGYERNTLPLNNLDIDFINLYPYHSIKDDITLYVDQQSYLKYTNELTEAGAVTLYTPQKIAQFKLSLMNGGAQTITWSNAKWENGITPTLTASGTDIIEGFTIDSGVTWYLRLFALDIK